MRSCSSERVAPYEPDWQHDHCDLVTDIVHTLINLTVLLLTFEALFALSKGFTGRVPGTVWGQVSCRGPLTSVTVSPRPLRNP